MPFYRRNNFRRPARRFSRFRSRGRALREPTSPKRWEVGRIEFDQNLILTDEDSSQIIFVPLAMIFDRVGDNNEPQGRALNNLARKMEVGGVVLDYSVIHSTDPGDFAPPGVGTFNAVESKFVLASDRLFEDGAPAALAPNFFATTTPVILAASTPADDNDMTYPMRVHHEDTFFWRAQQQKTNAPAVIPAWPQVQQVNRVQGRTNVRLKLALTDDQVLGFYVASVWSDRTNDYTSINALWNVSGKIYYRVRF